MTVLNGVVPVFLLVAVGALARRLGWMDRPFSRQLNRVIYYLAVPALLLRLLGVEREGSVSLEVIAAVAITTLLVGAAGSLLAAALRLPRKRFGVLVQASVRGNLVFMAFPVIYAAGGDRALSLAALLAAVLIPVQNLIAVGALGAASGYRGWRLATLVVLNPIVLGVAAGVAWGAAGLVAPRWLDTFLELLGSIAMPGALLTVGAQLEVAGLRARIGESLAAAALKLGLSPALGLVALTLLGIGGTERLVALLLLAAPTAVASTVVAQEMGGDVEYAGALVMTSTLCAFPAFILWGLIAAP